MHGCNNLRSAHALVILCQFFQMTMHTAATETSGIGTTGQSWKILPLLELPLLIDSKYQLWVLHMVSHQQGSRKELCFKE